MRGDTLTIEGKTAYPDSPVQVFVELADGSRKKYEAVTGHDGDYSLKTDPITVSGKTNIWSKLVFSSGAESPESSKLAVVVSDTFIVNTSKSIIYSMSFVIPALGLLIILVVMVYLGWHRFLGLKRKVRRESLSIIDETHKAFVLLKEEISEQLKQLESLRNERELNKKEEKLFNSLKKNIDDIDRFIEKKLRKMF
jgi:hypothetical protein